MKTIRVVVTGVAHASTTGINLTEAITLAEEARKNRLRVIEGSLSVENQLEAVILHYFIGPTRERREVFESLILKSDWCTFAAKRKLIMHIIADQNLLEGGDKSDFDKLMRKVMSARNAFAHGRLSSDDERVWLSYFEGTPRREELTDDYLTKIEELLRDGYNRTLALAVKIGATRPTEQSGEAS